MAVFKCKMCGAALEIDSAQTVASCLYCGTQQTLPRLNDDRRTNMLDRANQFRRNNEFDKATAVYEQLLTEDATDAEVYWSLVLCRYGVEYVVDPASQKRVPTIHRAQYTSIFNDTNYKAALEYADAAQRTLYEQEAAAINEIQKGILTISQKEEPFDVFICYKESDGQNERTRDSVLAQDLYYGLTKEGFKVFFARITLEKILGAQYEPYIFAALNSAKVMVVLGTSREHFEATWVKNEWSRYLALIHDGAEKTLIPAYRDMDPYDLPAEFSHLQAQDMGKLGFMQDLVYGIKKIVQPAAQTASARTTVMPAASDDLTPLLKRATMFLEDGMFDRANELCEQVLNRDPENAQAYLCQLCANTKCRNVEQLGNITYATLDSFNAYQNVLRFGNEQMIAVVREQNKRTLEYKQRMDQEKAQRLQQKRDEEELRRMQKAEQVRLQKERLEQERMARENQARMAQEQRLRMEEERRKEAEQIKALKRWRRPWNLLLLLINLVVTIGLPILAAVIGYGDLPSSLLTGDASAMIFITGLCAYVLIPSFILMLLTYLLALTKAGRTMVCLCRIYSGIITVLAAIVGAALYTNNQETGYYEVRAVGEYLIFLALAYGGGHLFTFVATFFRNKYKTLLKKVRGKA